ncbi:hypothetical protein FRB96_007371 [Tulasnella sp. 330]|nr:hypothetical protein FRB96_007371 [Tulasnella sp. 330]KAG8870510.1 hypothetical protein FRB98_001574 [Tulasnella sp. 332]KAG8872082.1 hypothetical protein FRB97_008059 [Tulasnella sp. 331]
MNSQYYPQGRSPPPLQHPIPTHAHYQIPEPPTTPGVEGYMRFTSPPGGGQGGPSQPMNNGYMQQQQPQKQLYGGGPGYGGAAGGAYQSFGGGGAGPSLSVPGAGLPNLAAWGVNDATTQMGMQLGRSAVTAGQDYVAKNFGSHLASVGIFKQQFNVSNSYVLQKLRVVLWPWRHKPWSRKIRRSETDGTQNAGYQPPRDDINAPDLYIPSMALVTYVLTAALIAGINKKFHPEVLGVAASKAIAVLLLDVSFVKLGCYFLNIQGQGQGVDLVAYGGYKFVGTIVTLLSGLLLGRKLYWVVFFYCLAANGFFLLRSLRYVVLPDPNANVGNSTVTHAQRGWRVRFLFIIAMMQILYMAILALL